MLPKGEEPSFELLPGVANQVQNPVVRDAIDRAQHQDFSVLDRGLGENPDAEEVLQNPRPIRVLVKSPFVVRPEALPIDGDHEDERVVLLERLSDTVVGRLAGQSTHILRSYALPAEIA
jgi:hypothetical protein